MYSFERYLKSEVDVLEEYAAEYICGTTWLKLNTRFFPLSLNHQRVLKCKEQNFRKRNSLLRAYTVKSCEVCRDGKRNTSAFAKSRQKKRQANPDFLGRGRKSVRAEKSKQIRSWGCKDKGH